MRQLKTKVLFIMNGLRLGGMERQLVELIKALRGTHIKAHLAILNTRGPYSDMVEQYLESPVIYLDRRKSRIPATLKVLRKIIKDKKIEIIHVQDSFAAFYALPLAKFHNIPLVNGMIRHAGTSKGLEYIIGHFFLKLSDVIIANSQAGLNYYKVRGHVLYNFIDPSRFLKSNASFQNIVMAANFNDYKDQMTFIMAAKRLFDEGRIKKIGFIGSGKNLSRFKGIVRELGIERFTTFHGQINNVEDVLLNYGIGILCSTRKYREGLSNSILEYMSTGLIAIGSDVGATNEVIEDGVNGYLFEAENPTALYEKVCFVLDNADKMDNIKINAKSTIASKFDMSQNVAKLLTIYSSIKR